MAAWLEKHLFRLLQVSYLAVDEDLFQLLQGNKIYYSECYSDIVDLLKACGKEQDLQKGRKLHEEISRLGFLEKSPYVGSALVSMYAKCGELPKAKEVLERLPIRNVVSWSALIAEYTEHGYGEEALASFVKMQAEGIYPDAVAYICALNACGMMKSLEMGTKIHVEILCKGLLEDQVILGNALIDMYAKCGELEKAAHVLDHMFSRDVVSWSALIAGYAQHLHGEEALNCFDQMKNEGISPNTITWICTLKACGILHALNKGKQIHSEIEKKSFFGTDVVLVNALMDMYAKCDAMVEAEYVLNEAPLRDVVTWSTLIAGYIRQGHSEGALNSFKRMQNEGLSSDEVTFSHALNACGDLGAVEKGKSIHEQIIREGIIRKDASLGTALVDMYAKCGALLKAHEMLDGLLERKVASWNALISGYAQHGEGVKALECFELMLHDGIAPDAISFVCVSNACTHSGLVDQGQMCFTQMIEKYGMIPNAEHYSCVVNLFSRSGLLEEALFFVMGAPFLDYQPIWNALLGACQSQGNGQLGGLVFEYAVELDGNHPESYISMSNICMVSVMLEKC